MWVLASQHHKEKEDTMADTKTLLKDYAYPRDEVKAGLAGLPQV